MSARRDGHRVPKRTAEENCRTGQSARPPRERPCHRRPAIVVGQAEDRGLSRRRSARGSESQRLRGSERLQRSTLRLCGRRDGAAAHRPERFGPAGQAEGGGRVPRREPGLPRDGAARRAARHRVRPPRRARRRLPRLHRRQPVRRVAARGAPARCCATTVFGNPHSVNPTSSAATVLVEQARAAVLRFFNAPESEYACIFTPNATGALRLVGEAYPFAPERPLPRHRSTTTTRSTASASSPAAKGARDGVRAARGARPARRRRGCSSATSTTPARRPQPVRLPGAVELLRRQAPAGVDRAGPGARLGRDRGLAPRSCRPAGSTCRRWKPDFVADLVLQDVRLPDRASARCSPGAQALARLQRPWFSGGTVVAANVQGDMVVPLSRPRAVRGRHGQLPRHPGGRDRPAPHRADRHRHDLAAGARRSARGCSRRCSGCATPTAARRPRIYGPTTWERRGGHDLVQLPAPGRPRGRRALRRRRRRRARHLASAPAASATRAPARPRSRSRATR